MKEFTTELEENLTLAIRAKCLDCSCQQKYEVEHCIIEDCSLYPYRPRFDVRPRMHSLKTS